MLRASLILDGKIRPVEHNSNWSLDHVPDESPHILLENTGSKDLAVTLEIAGTPLLQEFDAIFALMIPKGGKFELASNYTNGKLKKLSLAGTITCRAWQVMDWDTKTLACTWIKKKFPVKDRPGEHKVEWMVRFKNEGSEVGCFEIMMGGKHMFSSNSDSHFAFRLARESNVLFNRGLVGGKLVPINPEPGTTEGATAHGFSVRQAHLSDALAPLILKMPSVPEGAEKK